MCDGVSVNELLKANEALSQERDAQLQEITELRQKLTETQKSEQKLEKERDEAQIKLQEVCLLIIIIIIIIIIMLQ